MRKLLLGTALAALSFAAASGAHAQAVNATFAIQYFKVPDYIAGTNQQADPDFPGGYPTVAPGSSLGTYGLPVGTGVSDLGGGDSEITWWSPALNPNVTPDGTGTVSLPIAQNMYYPHATGGDDGTYFETAILTGDFTLASQSTVSFDLGSDDDSFIYVDGTLIGQNPGIHGVTTVDFTSGLLSAGSHDIQVFYDDREQTGAFLSLTLDASSSGIVITAPPGVPEPATWGLMVVGFGGLGAALRRRRSTLLTTAA